MFSAGVNDALDSESVFNNITGYGVILGKLPQARRIRMTGRWKMRDSAQSIGDGVLYLNGTEVLRLPGGERPFKIQDFDVDVTRFSGQHVMFEIACEGQFRSSYSDWISPHIIVEK